MDVFLTVTIKPIQNSKLYLQVPLKIGSGETDLKTLP